MACSIHVIWIISIKEHCFFNYIIFFWPLFLFINFLHSFHLTYKLSPASLPKKFTKIYGTLFEPIKLSKKEFKLLTQHSLIINLKKGENYQIENKSEITEKVSILLEGRLDVSHNSVHLHQIYPNDFIDSPEFKYIEIYSNENSSNQPFKSFTQLSSENADLKANKTCSNCKQVFIEIDNKSNKIKQTQPINLSMNKIDQNNEKAKLNLKQHYRKNSAFNKQIDRSNEIYKEKDVGLSIDSPMNEKFGSLNKLAQVTITASENCKLLCWKRSLLVQDTLKNNVRLRTLFNNLIGKDIIHKLYLVNEEQRKQQQQIISETQANQTNSKDALSANLTSKLLAHNPLLGDNLLSKMREINLLNACPYIPLIPNESLMYLGQYNRNLNIGLTGINQSGVLNQDLLLKQSPNLISNINPYLTYHPYFNQAIFNPILNSPILNPSLLVSNEQQQKCSNEMNSQL